MKSVLTQHFIPHAENDYAPHILQKTAVLFMAILLLLTFTFASMQSLFWTNSSWLLGSVLPAVIVDLTNENRTIDSVGSLTRNSALDRAAQAKAEHMAANGYFSHFAPDGTSPWFFFGQAGYEFVHAGENLAIHFVNSDDVVEAWMNSPTHRDNILNNDFTEIGIGVAEGKFNGQSTIFVVQHFGSPVVSPAPPLPVVVADITTPLPADEPVVAPDDEVVVPDSEVDIVIAADPVSEENVIEEAEPLPEESASAVAASTAPATTSVVSAAESKSGISAKPDSPLFLMVGRIATSPSTLLQLLYVAFALFIVGSLLLSIIIEIKQQRPVQIAYGMTLLFLMTGLVYLQNLVIGGALVA